MKNNYGKALAVLVAALGLLLPAQARADHHKDKDHDHHDKDKHHYDHDDHDYYYVVRDNHRYCYDRRRPGFVLDLGFFAQPRPVYVNPAPVYAERAYHYSVVEDVQRALRNRGYWVSVDGDFGPQTSRAIASYQNDHGLRVTGSINDALLRSLGI